MQLPQLNFTAPSNEPNFQHPIAYTNAVNASHPLSNQAEAFTVPINLTLPRSYNRDDLEVNVQFRFKNGHPTTRLSESFSLSEKIEYKSPFKSTYQPSYTQSTNPLLQYMKLPSNQHYSPLPSTTPQPQQPIYTSVYEPSYKEIPSPLGSFGRLPMREETKNIPAGITKTESITLEEPKGVPPSFTKFNWSQLDQRYAGFTPATPLPQNQSHIYDPDERPIFTNNFDFKRPSPHQDHNTKQASHTNTSKIPPSSSDQRYPYYKQNSDYQSHLGNYQGIPRIDSIGGSNPDLVEKESPFERENSAIKKESGQFPSIIEEDFGDNTHSSLDNKPSSFLKTNDPYKKAESLIHTNNEEQIIQMPRGRIKHTSSLEFPSDRGELQLPQQSKKQESVILNNPQNESLDASESRLPPPQSNKQFSFTENKNKRGGHNINNSMSQSRTPIKIFERSVSEINKSVDSKVGNRINCSKVRLTKRGIAVTKLGRQQVNVDVPMHIVRRWEVLEARGAE